MSLAGKYAFATVMCLVLPMCILTRCSSVLCVLIVDGLGYVYVCESYVVLDQCDEPHPCVCSLSVWCCSGVFLVFSFLCTRF